MVSACLAILEIDEQCACNPRRVACPARRVLPAWDLWERGAPDDRIRAIFKLQGDHPVPRVGRDSLRTYHRYLAARLSFPFQANYCEEVEPLVFDRAVVVHALLDPSRHSLDSSRGVLCAARMHGREVKLPLAVLKLDDDSANRRLVEDYWHWFWNCR